MTDKMELFLKTLENYADQESENPEPYRKPIWKQERRNTNDESEPLLTDDEPDLSSDDTDETKSTRLTIDPPPEPPEF